MKKYLLTLLVIFISCSATSLFAQPNATSKVDKATSPQPNYSYYILIAGVHSSDEAEAIENKILQKKVVDLFVTRGDGKGTFFELRTSEPITKKAFEAWLNNNNYNITYFGDKGQAFETAIHNALQ